LIKRKNRSECSFGAFLFIEEGMMEDKQFDDLSRALAAAHSRRGILRGAIAGASALTLMGWRGASAKNSKTQICHLTGNGSYHLIEVSDNAVGAHLGHGDGLLGSEDHCGSCGDVCTGYETCGGGGTDGQCGCSPTFAEADCDGVTCGEIPDGCGGTVTCGCTGYETCDGAGVDGQCGCTPNVTGADCDGVICGEIPDGCGGTVSCGCNDRQTCGGGGTSGQCGCTPTFTDDDCDGDICGEFSDSCGETVTCGCGDNQTCGGGGTDGQCGCTPTFTEDDCVSCGEYPDGCGGTVTCGCPGDLQVCGAENICVTPVVEAVQTSHCRAQAVLTNFPPNTPVLGVDIYGDHADYTSVLIHRYYGPTTDSSGSLTITSDDHIDGEIVRIGVLVYTQQGTYQADPTTVTCTQP
jgi:hypothetical protein